MRILTISIGKVAPLHGAYHPEFTVVPSAINKLPVSQLTNPNPIYLGVLGLEGDEQADLSVHGGIEKAVYAYPSEHYDFWNKLLSQERQQTCQRQQQQRQQQQRQQWKIYKQTWYLCHQFL